MAEPNLMFIVYRLAFCAAFWAKNAQNVVGKLAQASACAFFPTSVRWSQTKGLLTLIPPKTGNKQKRFRQECSNAFMLSYKVTSRLLSCFASLWLATSGRWSEKRHHAEA
jgi:hypothetical protein